MMSVYEHFDPLGHKADRTLHTRLPIPANYYSIAFGLVGLARVWRLAGNLYGLSAVIGDALFLVAAVMFLVFFVATVLLGGWFTGQWIVDGLDVDQLSPGYFLPTVAGCLLGAEGAARFGLIELGWMSFGIGMISLPVLGPMVLNRLFFHPGLPAALIPTLAIEIAPPALAGNAYFELTGGRVDLLFVVLAGYAVLMALVQLRLLPLYLKLTFSAGFWAFTFSFAATAAYALRWIHLGQFAGAVVLGYVVLAAITMFIGGIALRSLVALRQGKFLPAPAVS